MMKTLNKQFTRKKILITLFGVMFLLFMIPLSYGMYSGVKKHTNTTEAIEQLLVEDCHCEDVRKTTSAVGVQISKHGLSGQRVSYKLSNCDYTSISKEANRTLDLLSTRIDELEDLDIISLNFVNDESHEEVIIKNGKISEIETH